jgi:hypothetical protein
MGKEGFVPSNCVHLLPACSNSSPTAQISHIDIQLFIALVCRKRRKPFQSAALKVVEDINFSQNRVVDILKSSFGNLL